MRAPQMPAQKGAGRSFPARTAGLIIPVVLCAVLLGITGPRLNPAPRSESPSSGPPAVTNTSADTLRSSLPAVVDNRADPSRGSPPAAEDNSEDPLRGSPPVVTEKRAGSPAEDPPAPRLPFSRAGDAGRFNLLKMGDEGPTLLIIGGIQGDEPGGFSAAALLASHYRIRKGSMWVVPDLNFPSILQRSRGLFGDMNRKFASLAPSDPEYDTIARIKSILLDSEVDLILNLHDGSGFYRPTWEGPLHNPKRWGQSLIIDQEKMSAPPFLLQETAGQVEVEVNRALLHPEHRYHIHNTLTPLGNAEMEKTLSWFSVRNGKPAFGIEASKEFNTQYRCYYHLNVVESFMRRMGIDFERDFPLTPEGVLRALNSDLVLTAFNDRLVLLLDNARPLLTRIPFPRKEINGLRSSKPLLALVRDAAGWRVAYGNRTLTRIQPEYMDFDESLSTFDLLSDGRRRKAAPGDIVRVAGAFQVDVPAGYRVNAIGAQKEIRGSEAGMRLRRQDFLPRFSVDKNASVYRVEVYRGKAFAGMFLVDFGRAPEPGLDPMTAVDGPESALGR
ncbi:MAG: deacylase [Desulfovibrio sp.]|jgi:hypothetical protein|nr:deacylase [Desulfovibrio sp.]